jgi:hypothetical protein
MGLDELYLAILLGGMALSFAYFWAELRRAARMNAGLDRGRRRGQARAGLIEQ